MNEEFVKRLLEHATEAINRELARLQQTPEYWRRRWERWRDEYLAERDARRERMRELSRRERTKRGPSPKTQLLNRALKVLLRAAPNITAAELRDRLEADRRVTFDDDDIEFQYSTHKLIVRDLRDDAPLPAASVKWTSLRTYLKNARDSRA